MSFAKVTIVGNLTRDPESRYLQDGKLVLSFGMAANKRKKDTGATFFRVTAFGEQAERLATMIERGYIAKGRQLYVEGVLEESEFTGNDGTVRKSLEVTLTDWQFVGGGEKQGTQRGGMEDVGF